MVDFEENEVIDENLIFLDAPELDGVNLTGWNVVDVVDAGVDNTGATDVKDDLNALTTENTIWVFRPGTYHISGTVTVDNFDRFGMIGYGDATFEVDGSNNTTPIFQIGVDAANAGDELYVEGIRFDYSATDAGGPAFILDMNKRIHFKDIRVFGGVYDGPTLNIALHSSRGIGRFDRVRLEDGAQAGYAPGTSGGGPEGIFMASDSVGTVTFNDCYVEDYPNNGLYLSAQDGYALVQGGTFVDNGVCGIRIGDGDIVDGARILIEKASFDNSARGVWLRDGHPKLVNTSIVSTSADGYRPIDVDASATRVTIDNVDVQFDNAEGHGVYIQAPSGTDDGGTISNLNVHGDATASFAEYGVVAEDRGNLTFVGCQTNMSNVGGIYIAGSDAQIIGGEYVGAGNAIYLETTSTDARLAGFYALNTSGFNDVNPQGSDIQLTNYTTNNPVPHNGTRLVENGWGVNAGDPSVGGQWNGNGYEGLMVRDTTNGNNYLRLAGGWHTV